MSACVSGSWVRRTLTSTVGLGQVVPQALHITTRAWERVMGVSQRRVDTLATPNADAAILVLGSRVKPRHAVTEHDLFETEPDSGQVLDPHRRELMKNYRGLWPGAVLVSRLARAAQLAQGNDLMIVVSGKGEARAMAWWLAMHGVDPGRIVLEYQATSTNENLENAHALMPHVRTWLVVTSDFHAPRTLAWARHLGIPIRLYHASTPSPHRQVAFAREVFALPHSLSRIAWRRYRVRFKGGALKEGSFHKG